MVTPLHQLCAQLAVIVDFAVEDQCDVPGFVRKRLVAGFEINDTQPADGQGDMGQMKFAVAVGPAVPEAGRHPINPIAMRERLKPQAENSANSTHKKSGYRLQGIANRNPPSNRELGIPGCLHG